MTSYKTTLTKMMRQTLTALAALLMVGAMASCSENQDIETAEGNNDAYLNLCFSTHAGSSTRADEAAGNTLANNESKEAPKEESDIHNIKVWVFVSGTGDNAKPISYKAETLSTVANSQYALNLRFLRKIAGKEVENIDLYILANSESINMADQLKGKDLQSLTRKDLKDVCFSNPFGITSRDGSPESTAVTDAGLPISRAITDISVAGHIADTEAGAKNKGIKIPLVRAVSKLHFYFTRQAGAEANTDNVKVTRIDINGYTIPTESYVFPDEEKYEEAGMNQNATSKKYNEQTTQYVAAMLLLPGVKNEDIKAVADPESFKKSDSQSAQEYLDAFSKEGIQSHSLCYLRETTKAIKGKIYYSLGSGEKSVDFSIPTDGKAIRNRELVVYGYFLNGQMGKLIVTPTIQEWQDGGTYDYIDASTEVIFPDADKTDWGYKVYYGQPQRGPMITLKDIDTKGAPWILQTDNPLFGFVECNADGSYKDGQSADSYKIESYIINKEGAKKTLYFYVVPKNRLDMAQPHNVRAHVFLTKNPNERFVLNPDFKLKGCTTGEDAGKDIHFEQVL